MKKILLFLLLFACFPAFSQLTNQQVLDTINTKLPDNRSRKISEKSIRDTFKTLLEYLSQTAGTAGDFVRKTGTDTINGNKIFLNTITGREIFLENVSEPNQFGMYGGYGIDYYGNNWPYINVEKSNSGFFVQTNDSDGDPYQFTFHPTGRFHSNYGNFGTGPGIAADTINALFVQGNSKIAGNLNVTGTISGSGFSGVARKDTLSNFVNLSTNQTIGGVKTFTGDAFFNGVRVGLGSGSITTNTVIGNLAGNANTTGSGNFFSGSSAGKLNTSSSFNTYIGSFAGENSTGANNTSSGYATLRDNIGQWNVAFGSGAGRYTADITSNTNSSFSTYIGGVTKSSTNNATNEIVIGYGAIGIGNNTTVLGNSSTTFTRLFGNVGIGTSINAGFKLEVSGTVKITGRTTTETISITALPVYADNAAALSGGLTANMVYRTATGQLMIVF